MISAVSFGALPPKTQYISENLIIGAKQTLANLRQLRDEECVTSIIDLRNARPIKRFWEFCVCRLLGLNYSSQPFVIADKAPLHIDKFEKIHSIIQKNSEGRTLVHCNSGIHRSLLVGAFEKIKSGEIKSFHDLSEFLQNRNYFQLNKKVRLGRKVPLTPEDIRYRTGNLEYQRNVFWDMLNQ